MSTIAEVLDLLVERDRRRRPALHFDGPDDALAYQLTRLEALARELGTQVLAPTPDVLDALDHLAAVTRACRVAVAQMTDRQHVTH